MNRIPISVVCVQCLRLCASTAGHVRPWSSLAQLRHLDLGTISFVPPPTSLRCPVLGVDPDLHPDLLCLFFIGVFFKGGTPTCTLTSTERAHCRSLPDPEDRSTRSPKNHRSLLDPKGPTLLRRRCGPSWGRGQRWPPLPERRRPRCAPRLQPPRRSARPTPAPPANTSRLPRPRRPPWRGPALAGRRPGPAVRVQGFRVFYGHLNPKPNGGQAPLSCV
jgi:hypothetical protein